MSGSISFLSSVAGPVASDNTVVFDDALTVTSETNTNKTNKHTKSWWYFDGEEPTDDATDITADITYPLSEPIGSDKEDPNETTKRIRVTVERPYRTIVAEVYDLLCNKMSNINSDLTGLGANASRIKFQPDPQFGQLPLFLFKAVNFLRENEQIEKIPDIRAALFSVTKALDELMVTIEKIDIDLQPEKALHMIYKAEKLEERQQNLKKRLEAAETFGKNRKDGKSFYDKIAALKEIIRGSNGAVLAEEFATVYRERHATKYSESITMIVRTAPVPASVPVSVPVPASVPVSVPASVPVSVPASVPAAIPVPIKKSNPLAALMGKKVVKA